MKYRTSSSVARVAIFASFIFAFIAISPSFVLAQNVDTQNDGALILKKTVRRVILDVVVTDANGKPVPNLAKDNFTVREDNKKQKVLSFDVHNLDAPSDFAKLPPLPPNTFINVPSAPERGPLYVLLLDMVNTDMDDEPYARAQLLKFIKSKPDGTRFAIFVLSDELYLAQGFTDDQAKLYSVLDPNHPSPHIPRTFMYQDNFGRGNTGKMIHVFTSISRYLDGLPGRKNVFWFAGKFPLQLFPDDSDPVEYKDEVKSAITAMATSQASIYPVDIRGVVGENAHAPSGNTGGGGLNSDYRTGGQAEPANDGGSPGGPSSMQGDYQPNQAQAAGAQGYQLLGHDYMIEDEIAKVTGGRAFYSTNDLSGALETATEEGANYYTLTYSPTNDKYDGSLRNIRVDLNQKGYHLAYRRSYYSLDPDVIPPQELKAAKKIESPVAQGAVRHVGDSLYANMQYGAPLAHQLYFRAHTQPGGTPVMATADQMASLEDQPAFFRVRKKNHTLKPLSPVQLQTYVIDYTVMASAKTGAANARPPALELAAAAFDANGKMLNGVVENTMPNTGENQVTQNGVYRAREEIFMPLSAVSIRVAVRDVTTDRIGAMEVGLPLAPEPIVQAEGSKK